MNRLNLKREKLVSCFLDLIKGGTLLVLGKPGVGKTWLIATGIEKLKQNGIPVFPIRADVLDVNSLSDFQNALGLDNSLENILNYKSSGKRGVVFIDALDAARSEVKQLVFRQLISLILTKCKNWSIVASIRTYDARHSKALLDLFPSETTNMPHDFKLSETNYRHIYVPELSDLDINEALNQMPELKALYNSGNTKLKSLFRIPFNLWLFEQLIQEKVDINKLSQIQAAVQLFGLYWEYRVSSKDDSEDRKNILRKIVNTMVQKHTLSVRDEDSYIQGLTQTYKRLLSDNILTTVGTLEQKIAFEHNMLFDYAVSRLLMDESADQLSAFILGDKSRPIFLRPSIEYYFARLWHDDSNLFWEIFWFFQYNMRNEYLKIVPATTIINETVESSHIQPIVDSINLTNNEKYSENLGTVNRLLQVLKATKLDFIVDKDALWVNFLYDLRNYLNVKFIDEYVRILKLIMNKWDIWNHPEKTKIAISSRSLLVWAWGAPSDLGKVNLLSLQQMLAVWGIPLVCRSYENNPMESRKLLNRILERLGPTAIIREIYSLCSEIDKIWQHDPEFVIDIYKKVFSYKETSEDVTIMRGGVLSLSSTRRQDYEGCYYLLEKNYSKFISMCPKHATRAMVESVNEYVIREERKSYGHKGKLGSFAFNNIDAKYLPDNSHIWGDRDGLREHHLKILDDFCEYLLELSKKETKESISTIVEILEEVAKLNEVAVIWRKLLTMATRNAMVFGPILYSLLCSEVILFELDTSVEAGELLKYGFGYLKDNQRKEIVRVLFDVPKAEKDNKKKGYLEEDRNRLLACMPEKFWTKEIKEILEPLKEAKEVPKNKPLFEIGGLTSKPYTEEDWLTEEGINVKEANNKKLLELASPIKQFHQTHLNAIPTIKDIDNILAEMQNLKGGIEKESEKSDERVIETVLTHLASTCEKIVRNNDVSSKILSFCNEIFVTAGENPYPKYDKERDIAFDSPHWGPAPRIEAAEGIMRLSRRPEFVTHDNMALIKKLSKDSVPAVRFHIARHILSLYNKAQKDMWEIVEYMANNEQTNGVIAALAASLAGAAGVQTDKVLDVFEIICKRKPIEERKKSGVHNDPCVSTITQLSIFF